MPVDLVSQQCRPLFGWGQLYTHVHPILHTQVVAQLPRGPALVQHADHFAIEYFVALPRQLLKLLHNMLDRAIEHRSLPLQTQTDYAQRPDIAPNIRHLSLQELQRTPPARTHIARLSACRSLPGVEPVQSQSACKHRQSTGCCPASRRDVQFHAHAGTPRHPGYLPEHWRGRRP